MLVLVVLMPVANVYVFGFSLLISLIVLSYISDARSAPLGCARWFLIWWGLWLAWSLLGYMTNDVTPRQLFQACEFIMYGAIAVLLTMACRASEYFKIRLMDSLGLAAFFLSLLVMLANVTGGDWPTTLLGRNESAYFIVMAGVLPALFLLSRPAFVVQSRFRRWFLMGSIGVFMFALASLESRGALACAAAVIIGYFLFLAFGKRLAIAVPVLAVCIPLLAIIAFQMGAFSQLFDLESNFSNLERYNLLIASWRLFEAKPIFGWGWGSIDALIPNVGETVLAYPHPHNFLAHFSVELGFGGVVLFVLLLCRPLVRAVHFVRRGFRSEGVWCAAVAFCVLVLGAVDVVFYGASRALPTLSILVLVESLPVIRTVQISESLNAGG